MHCVLCYRSNQMRTARISRQLFLLMCGELSLAH